MPSKLGDTGAKVAAITILAAMLTSCGSSQTKTIYLPTSASKTVVKHAQASRVTLGQLVAASTGQGGGYQAHLTSLRAVGQWAMATASGPQPEQILFRETAGKWHVVREPVVGALPASDVPGMSATEAHVLGFTIITPQAEQQATERAKIEGTEQRSKEVAERLEKLEARQHRQHEQTCARLYREYQEGLPSVGEAGEVAPSSRAAIQEYGRMGCH